MLLYIPLCVSVGLYILLCRSVRILKVSEKKPFSSLLIVYFISWHELNKINIKSNQY